MKNKISDFSDFLFFQLSLIIVMTMGTNPSKDMKTSPLIRSGEIYTKDAHNAESNEKWYFRFFRFLFFELWLIVFTISCDTPCVSPAKKKLSKSGEIYRKDAHCSDNDFFVHQFSFVQLLIIETWLI